MGLSNCWADSWVCYKPVLYNKALSVQILLFKGLNESIKDVGGLYRNFLGPKCNF
ncbi:hypothetical protein Hanom_Chr01g00072341 [Helianthus anomalus]